MSLIMSPSLDLNETETVESHDVVNCEGMDVGKVTSKLKTHT